MTKREFLNILRRGLRQLPPEEVQKRLAYYEELLNDMTEDGMTEQEATASPCSFVRRRHDEKKP